MPLITIGYYYICKIGIRAYKLFLICASLFFYIKLQSCGFESITPLLIDTVCMYILMRYMKNKHKIVLFVGVTLNITLLMYYKYCNFFVDNFNFFINAKQIFIPIGISFFVFNQIMYLKSVHDNDLQLNLIDYLLYMFYFPKMLMGPLMEPVEFISQINVDKRFDWKNIAEGIKIFSLGLFKKIIFADSFSKAVAWGFNNFDTATSMDLFLVMFFYTLEIYFDFSGYSDMAYGISHMLQIDLTRNFNSPYKSFSLTEFWKKWHMSLTNFFTKYIYIPMGGNRKGRLRTYINIISVFLISGLWHGSNWTFVIWGGCHGIILVLERIFNKQISKVFLPIRWCTTMIIVSLLWLLFRSDFCILWIDALKRMVSLTDLSLSDGLIRVFETNQTRFFRDVFHLNYFANIIRGFNLFMFSFVGMFVCIIPDNNYNRIGRINFCNMFISASALILSLLCLGTESVFIYEGF